MKWVLTCEIMSLANKERQRKKSMNLLENSKNKPYVDANLFNFDFHRTQTSLADIQSLVKLFVATVLEILIR